MVNGRKELSKKFVAEVMMLGYETQKINPSRATREIVRTLVPRGHPEEDKLFQASEWFLEKQNGHYFYVEMKLNEFLMHKNKVAIMVNISNNLREQLESDFEAFSVLVSDNGEISDKYDVTILNNSEFSNNVNKLLRILTKDFSDIEEYKLIKENV